MVALGSVCRWLVVGGWLLVVVCVLVELKARAMKSSGVMTQTQVYSSIAETHSLKAKHAMGVVEVLVPHRTFCCSAEFPCFLQVLVPFRHIASLSGVW